MTVAVANPDLAPVERRARPWLENGDRLSRAEFERRYQRMPEVKKAELIEGVVYMLRGKASQEGRPYLRGRLTP